MRVKPTYRRHVSLLSEDGKTTVTEVNFFKIYIMGQKKTDCSTREPAVLC